MKGTAEKWESIVDYINNIDASQLRMIPELPKIQLKRKKTIYTVPDIRLLHPFGWMMLEYIVEKCVSFKSVISGNEETVSYSFPDDIDNETIEIVNDIVMGFSINAEYKDGSFTGAALICGFGVETDANGKKIVTYHVDKRIADFLRAKVKTSNASTINLITVCMDFADERYKEMRKWMKQ